MKTKLPGRGAEERWNSRLDNESLHRANDPHKHLPTGLSNIGPWGIPERYWLALRTGVGVPSGYPGALLTALVDSTMPETVLYDLILNPEHLGTAYFHTTSKGRPRSRGEALGMVRRAVVSKRRWLDSGGRRGGDRNEAVMYATTVAETARDNAGLWRRQGGATDLAVLLAVVGMAQRAGRWEFHASVRDVGEQAGVGSATAGRSLRRLTANGWLRRVVQGGGVSASMYRLTVPTEGKKLGRSACLSGTTQSVPPVSPALDAWRWGGGLGKSAHRAYTVLGYEPQTTTALASALGLTPRAVRYSMATLARYGLATSTPDGWIRGAVSPEEVGLLLPRANGAGERQRERNRIDRENRAKYLARGRRLRMRSVETIRLDDGGYITVEAVPAVAVASG